MAKLALRRSAASRSNNHSFVNYKGPLLRKEAGLCCFFSYDYFLKAKKRWPR